MIDVKKMRKDLLETNPTLYCSAMAHLRGKLHMSKLNGSTLYDIVGMDCWSYFGYNNKECVNDERRHMFNWTKEDQAKLVENILKLYTIEEEQTQVSAAM